MSGEGDDTTTDARDPDETGTRIVVVGPERSGPSDPRELDASENPAEMVDQPAKVMRIGTMIKQLLEEVRSAPLDEKARSRLAKVHERSLRELEDGLSPELVAELHRITLPLGGDGVPSDAELRIAQAQLVGWLEGLFHGIQTVLVAQQMAAQSQLAHMRGTPSTGFVQLPHEGRPTLTSAADDGGRPTPGQYL